MLEELVAGEDLARVADQEGEQLECLVPHLEATTAASELARVLVKSHVGVLERPETHVGDGPGRGQGAAAQEQTEARRLLEKAAKRAKSGEFQRAKDIYQRILELDPAMADARRELAMTLFELGDMAAAKDELIDALRLKADDAWSYVVLGNIYVKHDRDLATASRFFTRALES